LTGNSAEYGGGVAGSTLFNCIVYHNNAPDGANYSTGDPWGEQITTLLSYSCTTPLPTNGVGNIDADPQMLSAVRLSSTSPCIGAGSPTYASGVDIDGEPWLSPPCIGADQVPSGSWIGDLAPQILARDRGTRVSSPLPLAASVDGPAAFTVWDFGDGTRVTNAANVSHAWARPGIYQLSLTAYNDSHPSGVTTVLPVRVDDQPTVLYVNQANLNPVFPFTNWATAAGDIQTAVDAATSGDTVLVSKGRYRTGSRRVHGQWSWNRVVIEKPIRVESVNGPSATIIDGNGSVRCALLTANAMLSGFTLTQGSSIESGGGVWSASNNAVVTNCVVSSNSTELGGGGVCGCTLYNCTLTGNLAGGGGGAYNCTMNNCTLTDNSATYNGGGASSSTLYNCTLTGNLGGSDGTFYNCTVIDNAGGVSGTAFNSIVYYNSDRNYGEGTRLNYCCTAPLPTNGIGNIAGSPLFMDMAAGDFRLREGSPCIDAGTNLLGMTWTYWAGTWDPDTGEPVMAVGTITDATDLLGNSRFIDGDGDGTVAWDIGAYEFDPRMLRFAPALHLTSSGMTFTVKGEAGKSVRVERSRNLKDWEPVATVPIPASGQTLIDPAATAEPFLFYRAVSVP